MHLKDLMNKGWYGDQSKRPIRVCRTGEMFGVFSGTYDLITVRYLTLHTCLEAEEQIWDLVRPKGGGVHRGCKKVSYRINEWKGRVTYHDDEVSIR